MTAMSAFSKALPSAYPDDHKVSDEMIEIYWLLVVVLRSTGKIESVHLTGWSGPAPAVVTTFCAAPLALIPDSQAVKAAQLHVIATASSILAGSVCTMAKQTLLQALALLSVPGGRLVARCSLEKTVMASITIIPNKEQTCWQRSRAFSLSTNGPHGNHPALIGNPTKIGGLWCGSLPLILNMLLKGSISGCQNGGLVILSPAFPC